MSAVVVTNVHFIGHCNLAEFLRCPITYRITSNNSRGNYQFFSFFPAGIIRGRELLEVIRYTVWFHFIMHKKFEQFTEKKEKCTGHENQDFEYKI